MLSPIFWRATALEVLVTHADYENEDNRDAIMTLASDVQEGLKKLVAALEAVPANQRYRTNKRPVKK